VPRKKAAPQNQDMMFPPIGEEYNVPDPMSPQEPDLAAQLKELRETVGNVSKALDASSKREERLQNLVQTLAMGNQSRQAAPAPATASAPQGIDWSKLPDPAKEPEAFRQKLAEAIPQMVSSTVDARVAPRMQEQDRQQRLQDLRRRFYEKNEDLKDYDDLMDAVAGRMVADKVRGGMNPEQAVFGVDNGETFMDSVASALRQRIKAIQGDDGEEGEGEEAEPNVPDNRGRQIPRTLGIDTGNGALPAMPGKPNGRAAGQSDLISELKAEQARGKIY